MKVLIADKFEKSGVEGLQSAGCDVVYEPDLKDESLALAKRFPDFDVVATSGGAAEPPERVRRVGKTILVEVGEKGMSAVVLGFYDEGNQRVRDQRVILDSRYPNSFEIKRLFAAYQGQLKELGLAGLRVRAVPYPRQDLLGAYCLLH